MSAIEDLERKVQSLSDQLADANAKLQRARLDAAPVHVGDVVMSTPYGEVIVREVKLFGTGKPWIVGSPRKENGQWSRARRAIYGHYLLPPIVTGPTEASA